MSAQHTSQGPQQLGPFSAVEKQELKPITLTGKTHSVGFHAAIIHQD